MIIFVNEACLCCFGGYGLFVLYFKGVDDIWVYFGILSKIIKVTGYYGYFKILRNTNIHTHDKPNSRLPEENICPRILSITLER